MKRYLVFVVPFIACVIAINQLYLANFDTLTPWKGGGFGMFSSIRGIGNRRIVAYTAKDSLKSNPLRVNLAVLSKANYSNQGLHQFLSFPDIDQLNSLGRAALENTYRYEENNAVKELSRKLDLDVHQHQWVPVLSQDILEKDSIARFDHLHLIVQEIHFDSKNNSLSYKDILETHVSK